MMPAVFSDSGVSFRYPETWKLEREEIDAGWLVTVQSPGTAFFLLCRRDDCPPSADLADEALNDLRESYPELEAEPASSRYAGRVAHGYDVNFFLLDLTNSAQIRTFGTPGATLLLMWQSSDADLEDAEPVLRAL